MHFFSVILTIIIVADTVVLCSAFSKLHTPTLRPLAVKIIQITSNETNNITLHEREPTLYTTVSDTLYTNEKHTYDTNSLIFIDINYKHFDITMYFWIVFVRLKKYNVELILAKNS